MKNWSWKEAKSVMDWAIAPAAERLPLEALAAALGRSIGSVREFARRHIERQKLPWRIRPRWKEEEVERLKNGGAVEGRTREAVQKFAERHIHQHGDEEFPDDDKTPLTASEVARDLGISRTRVYRLLKRGVLRRFKGGIARATFDALIKEHPEEIPYKTLTRDHREWLVLMGYDDPTLNVKRPTTQGWLKDSSDRRKRKAS